MSRSFRSAYTIAQTAVQAGPSSHVLRSHVVPQTHLSRRTAFNLSNYIPSFFVRQKEREREEKTKPQRAEGEDKGIFDDVKSQNGDRAPQPSSGIDAGGVFSDIIQETRKKEKEALLRKPPKAKEHITGSARKQISPKKLNMLARQIQGLPIDEAILQMKFSNKAAARWVKSNLVLARDHAIDYKGMDREKLIVARSFVNKDRYGGKKMDIKGRGKHGIMRTPFSRIKYVLQEGKTREELREKEFTKKVNKLARSAGQVREDGKLGRKVVHGWHW